MSDESDWVKLREEQKKLREEEDRRDRERHAKFHEWVEKWQIGPGMNDKWRSKRNGTPPLTRYSGFDGKVGPGWVPILEWLADGLIKLGWDRDLHQVKEKFGTLRFYVGKCDPAQHALIDYAESESSRTCEECGASAEKRLTVTAWWKTLCEPCLKKFNEDREKGIYW